MDRVEVKNQTINYTIEYKGIVYNLHYYQDLMSYAEELTEVNTGLDVIDEDLHEEIMEFFHDNQPNLVG